jgi:hypothetical protein
VGELDPVERGCLRIVWPLALAWWWLTGVVGGARDRLRRWLAGG